MIREKEARDAEEAKIQGDVLLAAQKAKANPSGRIDYARRDPNNDSMLLRSAPRDVPKLPTVREVE